MDTREHERWWADRGERGLRDLLLSDWDPIGIAALAEAPYDEYEHYAGQIGRRLRAGASEDEVAAVLEGFRSDMGLEPGREPPLEAARAIRDWYARSTAAWRSAASAP